MTSITGARGYRRPGSDWVWSDGPTEDSQDVLHDLYLDVVNDDESDHLGYDVAIRDNDGVVHIVAKATDGPTELG